MPPVPPRFRRRKQAGCDFIDMLALCYNTSEPYPCDFFGPSDCPADKGCQFDTVASFCRSKSGPVPCQRFYEEAMCTQEGCTWTSNSVCVAKGQQPPCSIFTDNTTCPTDHCKFIGFTCMDKAALPACELYYSPDDCDAQRCQWHEAPLFLCWAKGREVPCEHMPIQDSCAANHACLWEPDAYRCVDCPDPSGSCTSPTAKPQVHEMKKEEMEEGEGDEI